MKSYGKIRTTVTMLIVRDQICAAALSPYTETITMHVVHLLQRFEQTNSSALSKYLERRASLRK